MPCVCSITFGSSRGAARLKALWRPALLLAACAALALPLAAQRKEPGHTPLFDIRGVESRTGALAGANKPPSPGAANAEIRAAVDGFRTPDGRTVSSTFGRFGLPKRLAAPGGALSLPRLGTAREAALAFLGANRAIYPFQPRELDAMTVAHETEAGELRVVRLQQTLAGLPVYGARLSVAVDGQGRVVQVASGEAAPGLVLGQAGKLSASDAALAALRRFGPATPDGVEALGVTSTGLMLFRAQQHPGLEAAVEAVVFPLPSGEGRRAWRVVATTPEDRRELVVDAGDGRVLRNASLVRRFGSARVWTDSPVSGGREVVEFPTGWLPEAGGVTKGNNADAFVDDDRDNEPDPLEEDGLSGGRATANDSGLFDHPAGDGYDFVPEHSAAAATNAFYFANKAHDYFYGLGFKETDGAFQASNGNLGGLAGDPMKIALQPFDLSADAETRLGEEGMSAVIYLRPRLLGDKLLHAAFDGDAVIHEYTHGVSSRLVGGPDDVSCLGFGVQATAIGEGVSDYFAASFFDDPVLFEYLDGADGGGRLARMDSNPRTFESLGDPFFEEHADGELVSAILWQVRTALGASSADKMILAALKLLPCEPSLVDLRDAILTAGGAANRAALWRIFAPRGLGMSSRGDDSPTRAYDTLFDAAFDLPEDLSTGSNRPPHFLSFPGDFAFANEDFLYTARAEDPNGDPITFRLIDGPANASLNATTGQLRYRGTFTSQRVVIEATDGKGGRTVHGLLIFGVALLTPGRSMLISGDRFSTGVGLVPVDGKREALQITTRGGAGDADLTVLGPLVGQDLFSERRGSNETITVPDPTFPHYWLVYVDGYTEYNNVTLAASFVQSRALQIGAAVTAPNGAETSETFYRMTVPPGTPRLRITATGGSGDADLHLAAGRLPVCLPIFGLSICDSDAEGAIDGSHESIEVVNPAAGDWFLNLQGFTAFTGVKLAATTSERIVKLTGVSDAAAYGTELSSAGIGTLFGEGFTDQTVEAGTLPLPTDLGGVRVYVDGVLAGLFYVSPTQINFQTPPSAGVGIVSIVVVRGEEVSQYKDVVVRQQVPRIFTFGLSDGTLGPVVTHADGSVVTLENPAEPGEVLVAYLTGAAITPQPGDGEPAGADPLSLTVDEAEATVGGSAATTLFSGATPGFVGLIQVNFQLADSLPPGSKLQLVIQFGDAATLPLPLPVRP